MIKKDLCDICGGELEKKIIDYELKVKREIIMIHNVTADKCNQCGEVYLDDYTSEVIDEIYSSRKKIKPLKYLPVPVFPFPTKA